MKANPLLAVVGMAGAGKSTAVAVLARRGWPVVYFGGITLEEMKRQGIPITSENERRMRESLRDTHGPDAYAKRSLPAILEHLPNAPTLVDGLYSWAEYKFLREHLTAPFYVIAVCAQRRARYERLAQRANRPLTPVEAEQRDFAEIENIQKGGPIAIADFTVLNDATLDELETAVNAVADLILDR